MGGRVRPRVGRAAAVAKTAVLAAALALPAAGARSQYGYDAPRGPYGAPAYEVERGYGPPRRAPREAAGLNCAAVQQGLTGPSPYSCPLPGPRPLGVRCFCDLPIAAFSPPQTAPGRVVP